MTPTTPITPSSSDPLRLLTSSTRSGASDPSYTVPPSYVFIVDFFFYATVVFWSFCSSSLLLGFTSPSRGGPWRACVCQRFRTRARVSPPLRCSLRCCRSLVVLAPALLFPCSVASLSWSPPRLRGPSFSVVVVVVVRGAPVGLAWGSRGARVGLPWGSRGAPVGLLWGSRGAPVGLPWGSRGARVFVVVLSPLRGCWSQKCVAHDGPQALRLNAPGAFTLRPQAAAQRRRDVLANTVRTQQVAPGSPPARHGIVAPLPLGCKCGISRL